MAEAVQGEDGEKLLPLDVGTSAEAPGQGKGEKNKDCCQLRHRVSTFSSKCT